MHVDELSLVERNIPRPENKCQARGIASKIADGCGFRDKIISCYQLFLMKNIESKKVVCFILFMSFCPHLQSVHHTLRAFLKEYTR